MSSASSGIIFIASLPHSGSTLLDLLLGSHSQIESLGEINRLKYYADAPLRGVQPGREQQCTCGAPSIWQCPHWENVEAVLRKYGSSLRDLSVASSGRRRFRRDNGLLYSAVLEGTGKKFVVDSSKPAMRLKMLLAAGMHQLYPVFLYRQPHGQINSMVKKYGNPDRALIDNLHANEALLDILQGHSFVAVRYEDIAADPPRALSRILNPLGLEFEDRQLDWARLPHHNLGGNRMRFSGNGELREDDSWRRTMAPELVERVDRATAKLEARIAECM